MSVTAGVTYTDLADEEHTMGRMHAKPARRDLLWVLIAILACGLLEVWASWLQLGAVSGFPKLGRMTTGWILPVTTEAYWTAALYAWLADPAGPRSRMFAMWSAAGVFLLSLAGQESDHLLAAAGDKVPPAGVVAFITALPLLSIALIAILIHLRQKDRDDAAETVADASAAQEIAALRAELEAAQEVPQAELESLVSDLEAERAARESAQRELAEALTRAEMLAKKLAAKSAQPGASKARKDKQASAQDEDLTLEFRALDELQKDPGLRKPRMGGELARRLGVSPATGRRLHGRLTAQDRSAGSLSERSAERPGERSGERS